MTKHEKYNELIKKLKSCKNRLDLKDVGQEISDFVKKYSVSQTSKEYKKLKDLEDLIKVKMRAKKTLGENKVISLTESQLVNIIYNITEQISDRRSAKNNFNKKIIEIENNIKSELLRDKVEVEVIRPKKNNSTSFSNKNQNYLEKYQVMGVFLLDNVVSDFKTKKVEGEVVIWLKKIGENYTLELYNTIDSTNPTKSLSNTFYKDDINGVTWKYIIPELSDYLNPRLKDVFSDLNTQNLSN